MDGQAIIGRSRRPLILVGLLAAAAGCGESSTDASATRDQGSAIVDAAGRNDGAVDSTASPVDLSPEPTDADVSDAIAPPPPDLQIAIDQATVRDLTIPPDLTADAGAGGARCRAAGGMVVTTLCCKATGDFPNLCLIGACGCSPLESHSVLVCTCPIGKCWDGTACAVMH